MAFCTVCGKDVSDGAKYCPNCGTPQKDIELFSSEKSNTLKANVPNLYGAVNLDRLPAGYVINDRYEVKEKLGQGGFAAVYRVFDRNVETDKALKVFIEAFSNDKEAVEDLRREGKIMMNLTHERIVRIFDVHTKGSIKYIDMEYVEGKSLADYKLACPDRKVPEEKVLELGRKIAEGLEYAHSKRVIHKDLKPHNILVTKDGEVKITDFGISDCIRSSMSRIANTTSSGTLAYMAPEQVKGEDVGVEVDIYGFGVLLYELLAGHPPFYQGDIHYQIFNEPAQRILDVSDAINGFISICLEKEYCNRYNDVKLIINELNLANKKFPTPIQNNVEKFEEDNNKNTVNYRGTLQKTKHKKKGIVWRVMVVFVCIGILASSIGGVGVIRYSIEYEDVLNQIKNDSRYIELSFSDKSIAREQIKNSIQNEYAYYDFLALFSLGAIFSLLVIIVYYTGRWIIKGGAGK